MVLVVTVHALTHTHIKMSYYSILPHFIFPIVKTSTTKCRITKFKVYMSRYTSLLFPIGGDYTFKSDHRTQSNSIQDVDLLTSIVKAKRSLRILLGISQTIKGAGKVTWCQLSKDYEYWRVCFGQYVYNYKTVIQRTFQTL